MRITQRHDTKPFIENWWPHTSLPPSFLPHPFDIKKNWGPHYLPEKTLHHMSMVVYLQQNCNRKNSKMRPKLSSAYTFTPANFPSTPLSSSWPGVVGSYPSQAQGFMGQRWDTQPCATTVYTPYFTPWCLAICCHIKFLRTVPKSTGFSGYVGNRLQPNVNLSRASKLP